MKNFIKNISFLSLLINLASLGLAQAAVTSYDGAWSGAYNDGEFLSDDRPGKLFLKIRNKIATVKIEVRGLDCTIKLSPSTGYSSPGWTGLLDGGRTVEKYYLPFLRSCSSSFSGATLAVYRSANGKISSLKLYTGSKLKHVYFASH